MTTILNNADRTPPIRRGEGEVLWETDDFIITVSPEFHGYHIVNRNTGQVELAVDQEHAAVISIQGLQKQYAEIMEDPEREFIRRERGSRQLASAGNSKLH